ncbi:MAG: ChaN family lipoprotein [Candidatus Rokuibacteriota bacterium]
MGTNSLRAACLTAALLLVACAALGPTPGRLVLPPGGDAALGARLVGERAGRAEVIYLGESHDNPHHHATQARILEALLATGARPALAFEMLTESQQATLDELLAGDETAADADRRLRWRARGWPDFSMYWPLFELARRHRLPVLATDLEPALVRRIAREGLAAVGDTGARLLSLLPPDAAREQAIARTIQEAHCHLLAERRLPLMVESWHARNVTIARHLAAALRRASPVVVIIGRGHQAAGGLPDQLEALRPGTRQLVVELLEMPSGQREDAVARRGSGDILWLTPSIVRPDPCEALRGRSLG